MTTDPNEESQQARMWPEVVSDWKQKASNNIAKWGVQDVDTLLLAMQEELGEVSQAYLEAEFEDGEKDRVVDELDDLAALVFQLQHAVEDRYVQAGRERWCEGCADVTPHRQIAPADFPGPTYECLVCPERIEIEGALGIGDQSQDEESDQ